MILEMALQKELDKAHRETKRLIEGMGHLHNGDFLPVEADKWVEFMITKYFNILRKYVLTYPRNERILCSWFGFTKP